MNLDLTYEETETLIRLLHDAIDGDHFPLSPRVMVLKEILGKLAGREPRRPAASPELRIYEPPSRGWYRRRG